MHEDPMLNSLLVNAADRKYQVWERNSLGLISMRTVCSYKSWITYRNPLQPGGGICAANLKNIITASALFYETGGKEGGFDMLTHFRD